MNKLNLGTGVANGATKGPTENTDRPAGEPRSLGVGDIKPGAPEGEQDVKDRLNPLQPVSGDNDVASQTADEVRASPPTPAEERKTTLENADLRQQLEDSIGQEDAANQGEQESADDGAVRFSSHPILNYRLGDFKFENGLLTLRKDEDVTEFRKLLGDLPLSERMRLRELDLSAAEAQSRAVRAESARASKGTGSDTGDRAPSKAVGRGELGDESSQ